MTVSLPGGIITSIPALVVCVFFTAGMVLLSQAGLWLFNRWHKHEKLERENEVAGIVFGAIGLLYSLILAFVIVAVWDDYNDLDKTIGAETDKLNNILAHSSTLPDSLKKMICASVYRYCDQVINQEWQMRKERTAHPSAIPALRHILLNTPPQNNIQERLFDVLDDDLSSISDLRRQRLMYTRSQMPQLVWAILKAGTLLLILFSYFFHVPSVKLKRIYLACFVTSISMCMFLVYSLDHPFDVRNGISLQLYYNVQNESKAYLPVPVVESHRLSLYVSE